MRTIYLWRYVADEERRRRVRRQLNKGESLHALRRDLFSPTKATSDADTSTTKSIRLCA